MSSSLVRRVVTSAPSQRIRPSQTRVGSVAAADGNRRGTSISSLRTALDDIYSQRSRPDATMPAQSSRPHATVPSQRNRPESSMPSQGSIRTGIPMPSQIGRSETSETSQSGRSSSPIPLQRSRPDSTMPSQRGRSGISIPSQRGRPETSEASHSVRSSSSIPSQRSRPDTTMPSQRIRPTSMGPSQRSRPEPSMPSQRGRPGISIPSQRGRPETSEALHSGRASSSIPSQRGRPTDSVSSRRRPSPESTVRRPSTFLIPRRIPVSHVNPQRRRPDTSVPAQTRRPQSSFLPSPRSRSCSAHQESQAIPTPTSSPGYVAVSCPICFESSKSLQRQGNTLVSTWCGHIFCLSCLTSSVKTRPSCPTCRRDIIAYIAGKNWHPIFI